MNHWRVPDRSHPPHDGARQPGADTPAEDDHGLPPELVYDEIRQTLYDNIPRMRALAERLLIDAQGRRDRRDTAAARKVLRELDSLKRDLGL